MNNGIKTIAPNYLLSSAQLRRRLLFLLLSTACVRKRLQAGKSEKRVQRHNVTMIIEVFFIALYTTQRERECVCACTDDDCCHSSEQGRDRRQEKKERSSQRETREIETGKNIV
jgi:hypothetical protein